MALQQVNESDEGEEYHSLGSGHEMEEGDDVESDSIMEPPVHPIVSMHQAFEESILESTEEQQEAAKETGSAEARRQQLLEAHQYDDAWTTRWKQKRGALHHPLLKLMAQIVFGMHLLQQQQAKSDAEVVKILQTHVNEVDGFLERTFEDFELAIADIEERIRHLKLPMTHLDVFNIMLDDKKFRTQLLHGNDNIEKIIDRTAKAMKAALMDVQEGIQATRELDRYLVSVKESWPRQQGEIAEVFGAMRGNEQGWRKYLKDLQFKGQRLDSDLVQLGTVIGVMSKLAAEASRRNRPQSRAISPSSPTPTSPLRSKFSHDAPPGNTRRKLSLNKPLPMEPNAPVRHDRTTAGAQQQHPSARSKQHPVPFAERYESPRASPRMPSDHNSSSRRVSSAPDANPSKRPKTAGVVQQPREARYSRGAGTADLADFFRGSGPTGVNQPPALHPAARDDASRGSIMRTKSRGSDAAVPKQAQHVPLVARTKSQGTAVFLTGRSSRSVSSKPADVVISSRSNSRGRGAEKGQTARVHSLSADSRKNDSLPVSNGFTRRLSERMKHIPSKEEVASSEQQQQLSASRASSTSGSKAPSFIAARRSAFVSSSNPAPPQSEQVPLNEAPSKTSRPSTPPPTRRLTEPVPPHQPLTASPNRPPSRLGLFPSRASEPLTPTQASKSGFSHSNGRHIPNALPEILPPVVGMTGKKSRSMSFRLGEIFRGGRRAGG